MSPIVLTQRLKIRSHKKILVLSLSAAQRNQVRGLKRTNCGREVLLQLPREGPLMEGDILSGEGSSDEVLVKAAIEELLVIRSKSSLELIKAVYHLANRHVCLELNTDQLFLLNDPVLEKMLRERGLNVEKLRKPFFPEFGAYSESHKHQSA